MLTAKNDEGRTVFIGDYKLKEELFQLKEDQYFCPVCNGKLVLKVGVQRISHFAHIQLSPTCAEFERESEYHMKGKLQLYQWLQKQTSKVEMEVYLPEIKQRPDLLFTFGEETYSLEYQCCTISEEVFVKRTTGYLDYGITPIWVLGGNQIHRKNTHLIHLSKFQSLFIKKRNTDVWFLPSYCSNLQSFITISHLQPLSPHLLQCEYSLNPLALQKLPQWLNPSFINTFNIPSWKQGVGHIKENLIRFQSPTLFIQELYVNHLHPLLLPPYVGVPLRDNFLLETSPVIWQTYVLIDNFLWKDKGCVILKEQIYERFIKRINKKHIKLRVYSHATLGELTDLLNEYLFMLSKCQLVKDIQANRIRLENRIMMSRDVMEARIWEEQFYNNLYKEIIVWN